MTLLIKVYIANTIFLINMNAAYVLWKFQTGSECLCKMLTASLVGEACGIYHNLISPEYHNYPLMTSRGEVEITEYRTVLCLIFPEPEHQTIYSLNTKILNSCSTRALINIHCCPFSTSIDSTYTLPVAYHNSIYLLISGLVRQ